MNTQEIIERLITARENAGLSESQAAKLLKYGVSIFKDIESQERRLPLSLFLKMCKVYDVSPVWALTGVNPDFDVDEFNQLTQFCNAAIEDIHNLRELLESLNHG